MRRTLRTDKGVAVPALLKTRVLVGPDNVRLLMVIVPGKLADVVPSMVTVWPLPFVIRSAESDADGAVPNDHFPPVSHLPLPLVQLFGLEGAIALPPNPSFVDLIPAIKFVVQAGPALYPEVSVKPKILVATKVAEAGPEYDAVAYNKAL